MPGLNVPTLLRVTVTVTQSPQRSPSLMKMVTVDCRPGGVGKVYLAVTTPLPSAPGMAFSCPQTQPPFSSRVEPSLYLMVQSEELLLVKVCVYLLPASWTTAGYAGAVSPGVLPEGGRGTPGPGAGL